MATDHDDLDERAHIGSSPELNRAVYERFLSSDYPEALRLADVVLERDPQDELARAVRLHCTEALSGYLTARRPMAAESTEVLGDDDILSADDAPVALADGDLLEVEADADAGADADADADADTAPFTPSEEATGPTLSLGTRGEAAREVYRLFLASDYAPALALADELISRGEDDGMLVAIARECRAAITTRSSVPVISAAPEMLTHLVDGDIDTRAPSVLSRVDGRMTIEEVAQMTGVPLDDVLGLLERFVAMGVLTLRPPPAPR